MITSNEESTLNLPFKVRVTESAEHSGVPFAFVEHDALSISAYLPMAKAKERFRKELTEEIEQALRAKKHTERHYIGMGDGTVFCVFWDANSDGWYYDIVGPNRKYKSGGTSAKTDTLESTIEYVKQGFADVMGGIVWEC